MTEARCWAGSLFAIAFALVLGTACGRTAERPNFVLVVVDTLRADFLAHAGGPRPTPNVDALQRESTRFTQAYSTSSWTLPALASLFLSQVGSQHGAVTWGAPLAPEKLSVVEALREAGYRTGGWVANVLIDDTSGFDQGFEKFETPVELEGWGKTKLELFPNAPAALINELALGWLRDVRADDPDNPFFLYLHYMEPHTPYRCTVGGKSCVDGANAFAERLVSGNWQFSALENQYIRGLYGGEVVVMDAAVGALLSELEAAGHLDSTWVILTADHGELLGERGHYLHGESLFPEEIRIPLLIRAPSRRGRVVHTPVSLIDVAPTLLDLAGIEIPTSFRGRSLKAALNGSELAPRPIVAELFSRAGVTPRHRLVVADPAETIVMAADGRLSRVVTRPGSSRGLPVAASPADLSRVLGDLESWIDFSEREAVEAPKLSDEMRERLRDLGYAR